MNLLKPTSSTTLATDGGVGACCIANLRYPVMVASHPSHSASLHWRAMTDHDKVSQDERTRGNRQ